MFKTDKISKEILNIKHKNREVMSNTIHKFQTPLPLESEKLKKIVKSNLPNVPIDDIITIEKKNLNEVEMQL